MIFCFKCTQTTCVPGFGACGATPEAALKLYLGRPGGTTEEQLWVHAAVADRLMTYAEAPQHCRYGREKYIEVLGPPVLRGGVRKDLVSAAHVELHACRGLIHAGMAWRLVPVLRRLGIHT